MDLEIINEEEIQKRKNKIIASLTEKQKSQFTFKQQALYKIGNGHDFLNGFYREYVTKTGIEAKQYADRWNIDSNEYIFKNNEFVLIERKQSSKNTTTDFTNISFPMVKKSCF